MYMVLCCALDLAMPLPLEQWLPGNGAACKPKSCLIGLMCTRKHFQHERSR